MSAIKEAYIMFNDQKVVAQYDERTKTWTATTNAPANSSWSQPDHVYKVEIHAVDAANNEATMTSANPTYGDQLKIRVLEKSKPTATIVSPTQGSVLGASEQDIVLEMSDTKAPIITDVVAEATTVDSGGTIKITFKVTDAA